MTVRSISKGDAALTFQVLNQLANFLVYSQRKGHVEPVAGTLEDLRTRMRAVRDTSGEPGGIELTDAEIAAVALLIPEIVRSLDGDEFSLRTGYQPEEALAARDRLLEK